MNNSIIIGFPNLQSLTRGTAYWGSTHLSNIVEYTNPEKFSISNIKNGYGYITGKANDSVKAYELNIISVELTNKSLLVKFKPLEESSYTSLFLKIATREYLMAEFGSVMNLPFCSVIDEDFLTFITADESLYHTIKQLKRKNLWREIYNLFKPIENINSNPVFWNNTFLLDHLSFASAKLSETYINIKRNYPDNEKQKNFLDLQRHFRKLTVNLRKRLIELRPDNPGYYSNLAYSYYQFVRELSMFGGRRDGNIKEDADNCIKYIDKALAIDPNRINDIYRKAQILSSVMPNLILYAGKSDNSNKSENENAENKLRESIDCYKKVIEIFELLPQTDEKSLARYLKEYIKSIYNISSAYYDLIALKFDYLSYFGVQKPERYIYNLNIDLENIDNSLRYIMKCINCDSKYRGSAYETLYMASYSGNAEAVYKLYSAGKYLFKKYEILKIKGDKNRSMEYLVNAEKYYKKALETNFSKELQKQSKDFIKEKLARVYLEKGNYDEGIKILKPLISKQYIDYYILYTYAVCEYKLQHYDKAIAAVERAIKMKGNIDKKKGELMLEKLYQCKNNTDKREKLRETIKNEC